MVQKITQAAIDTTFGSTAEFDEQILEYTLALKRHAKTRKGEAAPTAHAIVELIVKQHGGRYEAVPEPAEAAADDVASGYKPIQPVDPGPMNLEQKRQARRDELVELRYNRVMDGVTYKGHPFNGDPLTLNSFMATLVASEDQSNILVRWKDSKGGYIELERSDILVVVKVIRNLTQACFDNEYRLLQLINNTSNEAELAKVNLTTGWPE